MARFLRLSDDDVERLFRGVAPEQHEDLRDLAGFLADAAERLALPPRDEVEARHLALLGEALERPPSPAARSAVRSDPTRHRTVRWAAKVVVAAASLLVATAALAFAGVDIPGTAAETAFQSVGLDLPNQDQHAADAVDPDKLPAEASETANRVLTVIHEWFSGADWSGCEFGARVSAAARSLEGEPDTSRCDKAGSAEAHGGGSDHAQKGLDKANEASGGAAQGGGAAANGRNDANEASAGAPGGAGGSNAAS
jgi:hypothetical protein